MDNSKELTKMIKGIRIAIFVFERLKRKARSFELIRTITETLDIFHRQLSLMVNDASMADYRLSENTAEVPFWTKGMMVIKLSCIIGDHMVKRDAIKSLDMGLKQGNRFIEQHPNLDQEFKKQIQIILSQYEQMIQRLERA